MHFPAATSIRLTGHGSSPCLESICSTKLRVLAATFEGRRWSVSRGLDWNLRASPFPVFFLSESQMTCSVSHTSDIELGQAPTSQARARDTDHLRPSKVMARALSLVEPMLSKLSGDPCPVRRGIVAVKSGMRKARFFRCPGRMWNRRREAGALCGF